MLKNDALLLSVKIPNDLYQSLFSRILYSRNEQLTYFFDRLMALDEIEIKKNILEESLNEGNSTRKKKDNRKMEKDIRDSRGIGTVRRLK